MNQSDPWTILISCAVCIYFGRLWYSDLKQQNKGEVLASPLPGAHTTTVSAVVIAVIGALIILGGETWGEYALDISAEQSDITFLFLAAMISASFVEELIFRGYLIIDKKGTKMLIMSIVVCSLVFALIHPYLWNYEIDEGKNFWDFESVHLSLDLGTKAIFSTAIVFINSLWFYTVRVYVFNPSRSLIPCFAAHFASNIGVFLIKYSQGHVTALY